MLKTLCGAKSIQTAVAKRNGACDSKLESFRISAHVLIAEGDLRYRELYYNLKSE